MKAAPEAALWEKCECMERYLLYGSRMDREMGRERIREKIKLYSSTEIPVRKNCIGKKREAVYNKLKFRAFLSQSERRNAK